ncbi:MAG: tripartite tricarboxylate transporter TctB family protein [Janthinobacterium lividum]
MKATSDAVRPVSRRSKQDYYGGALMMLIGTFAWVQGAQYDIGSVRNMGPGFFPVALGVLLVLTGLAIVASPALARLQNPTAAEPVTDGVDAEPPGLAPEWRGWICIMASLLAFIVLASHGGLLPATFVSVWIAAIGDRDNTLLRATILAALISIICVVVFWWGLKVQCPLFDWS